MATVPLFGLGTAGIEKDIPSHLMPPELWSDGLNFRCKDGYIERSLGHQEVFAPTPIVPYFLMNVPATDDSYWLAADLTSVRAYNASWADISRVGGYNAVNGRDWNGCMFGGIPILNNGIDVPQWWSVLSLTQDLEDLPAWPATLRAKVIRNFGTYLFALNLKDADDLLPHAIQWSHTADPGTLPSSWDNADATKDAGRTHLTDSKGGDIVDGKLLGDLLIVYKQRSTHAVRFVGGLSIFAPAMLFEKGALAPRCITSIDNGLRHFVLGEDNVFVHSGTRNVEYPLEARDKKFLFADMDTEFRVNSHCFENAVQQEAWLAYPSTGNQYPNKALIWNYKRNTVTFREFNGMSATDGDVVDQLSTTWDADTRTWDTHPDPWNQQGTRRLLYGTSAPNTQIFSLDTGFIFGDQVNRQAFLQRTGLAIVGKDRQGQPKADYQSRKLFKRIWLKIKGTAAVQVRLGAQEELDGSITWQNPKTFIPAQKYLDFEAVGRLGAVEITTITDGDCRIDGYDLELENLGNL